MGFSDFPFYPKNDGTGDARRYPGHGEFLRYIRDFCDAFGLMDVIRLNTKVLHVGLAPPRAADDGVKRWTVRCTNANSMHGDCEGEVVRTSSGSEGLGKHRIRVGSTKEFGVGSSRKNEDGSRPSSEFVSGFGSYMMLLSSSLAYFYYIQRAIWASGNHTSHSGPEVRVLGLRVLLLSGADDLAPEDAPPASASPSSSPVSWLLTFPSASEPA
jgi:hypothetical protein